MRSNWLYLAMRSVRLAEPVLIWPALVANHQVRDERIFGFAGAVRNHRCVMRRRGHVHGLQRFGDRADLIQLDQNRIRDARVRCRAGRSPGW